MRRFAASILFFLGIGTTSCAFLLDTDGLKEGTGTDGGSGGTGGASSIPLDDAPAAAANAICAAYVRCMGPAIGLVFPEDDCVERATYNLQDTVFATMQASIAAGKTIYHADKMPACVAAYEARDCALVGDWPVECADAVEGSVPLDGDCSTLTECAGIAFCDTNLGCPGKCTALRGAGEPCLHGGYCDAGLTCWSGKCTPLSAAGEACEGNTAPECHLGLLCIGNKKDESVPGKCFPADTLFTSTLDVGCSFDTGPLCLEELHCKVTSDTGGVCTGDAANAGPCSLAIPDQCPAGQFCQLAPMSPDGQCTAIPGPNQPCAEGLLLKPPCQAGYLCIEGVCKPMARLGQGCADHVQCYSEYCNNGVCTAPGSCY